MLVLPIGQSLLPLTMGVLPLYLIRMVPMVFLRYRLVLLLQLCGTRACFLYRISAQYRSTPLGIFLLRKSVALVI